MGRRGRKRQLGLESEYWRLVHSGVGTVQACRAVGITRKTGYRWRAENGGIPPVRLAEAVLSSRYLSRLERHRISTLREQGHGVREIARRIGRAPSTVSRELARNLSPHDHNLYDGDLAHDRARERARRRRRARLVQDVQLRDEVQAKLELEWSPGTDRCLAASDVPRPRDLARVSRDDASMFVKRPTGASAGSWPG